MRTSRLFDVMALLIAEMIFPIRTFYIARETFASAVILYNDIPMEIVSELLGHSSMKITQDSYGKVVQRKISLEMERLKGK